MPTYWYLSAAKLAGLGASDPGLFGRIRTKAKLGAGGAGLEIGLDPVAVRRLDRAAAKAEADLRRKGKVADVSSFRGGPPPAVYFSSQGSVFAQRWAQLLSLRPDVRVSECQAAELAAWTDLPGGRA